MDDTTNKKTSKRVYGGLSEEERVLDRRDRFMEAGLELFGTVGLRGATVRALCREAGLTERYFYESFTDTEALFCAVYEKQILETQTFFATRLPQLPEGIEERIALALDLYFTRMRDSRVVRVLYLESLVGSQRVIDMHHSTMRMHYELVAQWIEIDNPALGLSHGVVLGVAVAVNGASQSLAVEWMLADYSPAQHIMVESCTLVVLGIMRELQRRAHCPA